MDHVARRLLEARLADVMAGLLLHHDTTNIRCEVLVGSAAAHLAVEVVIGVGEKAGAEAAVGGNANAAAMAAEGMRDGCDNADLADSVAESVAFGGLAEGVGGEFDEACGCGAGGTPGVEACKDLVQGDYGFGCPGFIFFQWHELDEADDDALAAGELGEGFDLRVVEAAEEDAVDLDRTEAGGLGGANAGEDALVAAGDAGDEGEGVGVDCIHADGDAGETCAGERCGERFEQMAVGGEGDVERAAGVVCGGGGAAGVEGGAELGELGDHVDQAGAEEGFAAGEADFFDAERDHEADHADVVGDGEFGVVRALIAGAAVDALVVAAVGDGDAEIGDSAVEGVAEAGLRCFARVLGRVRCEGDLRGGLRVERRWMQGSDMASPSGLDDFRAACGAVVSGLSTGRRVDFSIVRFTSPQRCALRVCEPISIRQTSKAYVRTHSALAQPMSTFLLHIERWMGEQAAPLFLVGFALLMGLAFLYLSAQSRQAGLVRDRSGRSEETFAEYLAAYGFDPGIARATYRYLQRVHGVAFPILPKDDLDRELGLDDDEVKQALRDLLDEVGREYLPGLIDAPVVKVVDLVRYVQASPRRAETVRRRSA
jgi:hypothetical protein